MFETIFETIADWFDIGLLAVALIYGGYKLITTFHSLRRWVGGGFRTPLYIRLLFVCSLSLGVFLVWTGIKSGVEVTFASVLLWGLLIFAPFVVYFIHGGPLEESTNKEETNKVKPSGKVKKEGGLPGEYEYLHTQPHPNGDGLDVKPDEGQEDDGNWK